MSTFGPRRRIALQAGVTLLTVLCVVVSGCAPSPSPPISRETAKDQTRTSTPTLAATRMPVPLHEPGPVRRSWSDAMLTANFCGVSGPIRFRRRQAVAPSTVYGQVSLYAGSPSYGTLTTIGTVAAIPITCNNGGGTGAGDLASAFVIVAEIDDRLVSLAEVTPQTQVGERAHSVSDLRITGRTIEAREYWYRSEDATCCPSGQAVTTWRFENNQFTPGYPHVTQ